MSSTLGQLAKRGHIDLKVDRDASSTCGWVTGTTKSLHWLEFSWQLDTLRVPMRYSEPSIIEALCEFVFASETPWDLTVFGRFDERLQGRLPVREQVEVMVMNVRNVVGGIEQGMVRQPRVRFFNKERTRLAQVGQNLLSANVLPPYPHWQPFRAFILETLDAYIRAATPAKIDRMTLRYIDRIKPPKRPQFRLGDWIQDGSPYIPSCLRESTAGAWSRLEKPTADGSELVAVAGDTDADGLDSVMLDTELVVNRVDLDVGAVGARLDILHDRMVAIFEACVSDETRGILRPEKG